MRDFFESLNSSWYVLFNAIEGTLWMAVAWVVAWTTPCGDARQRLAARLAAGGLVMFGITDWLECRFEAMIPTWLRGLKIACGAALLMARYTWLGWQRFRFRDREVLFAVFCLISVFGLIGLQRFAAGK